MIRFNSVDFKPANEMSQKPILADISGRSINGTGYRDILFVGKNEYDITFNEMTEAQYNTLVGIINTPSVAVECTVTGHTFNFSSAQVRLNGEVKHGYSGIRENINITVSQN
jgi:hypothetical protein